MESFPLWRGVQPREPAWKRAKNQGCSRGSVGKQRFRRCESANEEETEGKGRGIGEKAGEKKRKREKKNRKSVGKRNYRLMRRSFHRVASEREERHRQMFHHQGNSSVCPSSLLENAQLSP